MNRTLAIIAFSVLALPASAFAQSVTVNVPVAHGDRNNAYGSNRLSIDTCTGLTSGDQYMTWLVSNDVTIPFQNNFGYQDDCTSIESNFAGLFVNQWSGAGMWNTTGTYQIIIQDTTDPSFGPTPSFGDTQSSLNVYVSPVYTLTNDPTPLTLTELVNSADNGFASTTGSSIGDAVVWAGTSITSLFIGSGLAVLYNLRYWIVALMIIGALVFFAYSAFRFFRH